MDTEEDQTHFLFDRFSFLLFKEQVVLLSVYELSMRNDIFQEAINYWISKLISFSSVDHCHVVE